MEIIDKIVRLLRRYIFHCFNLLDLCGVVVYVSEVKKMDYVPGEYDGSSVGNYLYFRMMDHK